jgi:hypothetical protein
VKDQIAFYASTPAYRTVLERHGWGDLQEELTALTRAARWVDMDACIDADVRTAFAIVAEPEKVASAVQQR